MKDTVIALFSNGHGAGKTAAADYLWKKDIGHSRVLSFSTPIKTMTKAFLREAGLKEPDIDVWMSPNQKDRRIGIKVLGEIGTPRHIMQTLGTEWGRTCISESLWLDMMDYRISQSFNATPVIIIDDLRFLNEAYMLDRHYHAFFVRICGPENRDTHVSEQEWQEIDADFAIDNSVREIGLEYFHRQLDAAYEEILKRNEEYS
jgi:hypothetical protein